MPTPKITPRQTTTRDPVRNLPGNPGWEFPSGTTADYALTEVRECALNQQPLDFGSTHPTDPNLRLIGQKFSEGENGKRNLTLIWASVMTPTEQRDDGYRIEAINGDPAYPRLTWTLRVEDAGFAGMEFAPACLVPGYTTLSLVSAAYEVPKEGVFGILTLTFEKVPGPTLTSLRARTGGGAIRTQRQNVLASTAALTGGAGVTEERVTARDFKVSVHEMSRLVNGAGEIIETDDGYLLRRRDPETGTLIYTLYRVRAPGDTHPEIGEAFPSAGTYCTDFREQDVPDCVNVIQVIEYCGLPATKQDYVSVAFQFPAIFEFNGTQFDADSDTFRFRPPWVGDPSLPNRYRLEAHRNLRHVGRRTRTYSAGPPTRVPDEFRVVTPGTASKYFKDIPNNCIHPAWQAAEYDSGGTAVVVFEDIEASTPATYSKNDVLVAEARPSIWRGNIHCLEVIEVCEARVLPIVGAILGQSWTSYFKGLAAANLTQPPVPSVLVLKTADDADAGKKLRLYASTVRGGVLTSTILEYTLGNSTTPVLTNEEWTSISVIRLVSTCAGAVTVQTLGSYGGGALRFNSVANGQTLTIGQTGSERVYTFTSGVPGSPNVIKVGSTAGENAENIASALNADPAGDGTIWGTGTAQHALLSASIDPDDDTILLLQTRTAGQQGISFTASCDGDMETVVALGDGADGTTIATIPAGQRFAYDDIVLDGGAAFPPYASITTDPITLAVGANLIITTKVTGGTGLSPVVFQYQIGDGTTWGGAVNLPATGPGKANATTVLAISSAKIRLIVTNPNHKPVVVSAGLQTNVPPTG